jgi:hypothetical protein
MTEPRDDEWERQHLHILFYDNHGGLGLCGCGNPEDAYGLVRDLLGHIHERGEWKRFDELIGSTGAVHIVLGQLDRVGLTDHGGVIHGAWLTDKGKYALYMMRRHGWESTVRGEMPDGVDDAGSPHWVGDGMPMGDCTDACWTAPNGVLPPDAPARSLEEIREAIQREADEARARMSQAQRAVMDATERTMTNWLLYGSPVAPENPPQPVLPGALEAFGDFSVDWPIGLPAGHWSTVSSGEIVIPDPGYVGRLQRAAVPELDRLPRGGRSVFIGCQRHESGTWVHGRPHNCPLHARGQR